MEMICLHKLDTKEPMLINIEQISSIMKRDEESIWVYLSNTACDTLGYKLAAADKFSDVFHVFNNRHKII